VILWLLAFAGGATFVQIQNSYPDVKSTVMDPKDAFAFPFVVSNDQNRLWFYNVTPSYESYARDVEQNKIGKKV
jgi:hypothetical protein